MEKQMSLRYDMVDILRVVFCILVVTIHTEALKSVNENLYIADSLGIARLAVPFFFITTGYFLYNRINSINEPKYTLKRFFFLFWKWTLFELLFALLMGMLPILLENPIPMTHSILLIGCTGSLWYVSSLIFAILFSSWFLKKDKLIPLFIIGIILYLFGTTGDTYYSLFENTFLNNLTNGYSLIFLKPNMGITVSVIFLCIGALINKYKLNTKIKNLGVLSILSIILLLIEAFTLINLNIPIDYNMYISVIFSAPLIFMWALNSKVKISDKACKICRDLSLGIYCSHQMFIMILFFLLGSLMQNTFLKFILTLLTSSVFIIILRKFKLTKKMLK